MKIKVHREKGSDFVHESDPFSLREVIGWILFCLILVAGAFGWGYIYKDQRDDDLRERVHSIEMKQRDRDGRLTSCETILDRMMGKRKIGP